MQVGETHYTEEGIRTKSKYVIRSVALVLGKVFWKRNFLNLWYKFFNKNISTK